MCSEIPGLPFRIRHLVDAPSAAPQLERWFIAEWAPWYGPDGEGDAAADLAACVSRDALPLCLVAFDVAGDPTGTVALRARSVGSDVAPGPWLAGLFVAVEHRNRGIGAALIAALETETWRLGFDAVYTSTDAAQSLIRRAGWAEVGVSRSLRGDVTVYRKGVKVPDA